jgi:hypothetical protein
LRWVYPMSSLVWPIKVCKFYHCHQFVIYPKDE